MQLNKLSSNFGMNSIIRKIHGIFNLSVIADITNLFQIKFTVFKTVILCIV